MGSLTEKERQFGKIITGFANTEDTYEAFFNFLFNTQMIIGLFPVSIEKAKSTSLSPEAFRSLSDIEKELLKVLSALLLPKGIQSLSDIEKELLELLAKNDELQGEVNSLLQEFDYRLTEEVDLQTIFQIECETDGFPVDNRPLIDEADRLVNIEQAISDLEDQLSKGKVEKIRKLTDRFVRTLYIYKHVTTAHEKCREVLEKLVQGRELNEIAALDFFMAIYNQLPRPQMIISDNGIVKENSTLRDRKNTFEDDPEGHVIDLGRDLKGFLSDYLIEFLKKSENKKYIGQCRKCQRYFVATRLNGQKSCSDKCRLDWNNQRYVKSGKVKEYKKRQRNKGRYQ